ncbi:hypothetical protein LEP1GSC008_4619 [Leptospira kirschneri serovar Bulgarica str. Nikolaevo]|uniref:Uncharacterized protein n=1 Tax=Leptospira kirschneri serovar Bulgarica str. Nikolaevo TaxID=1240687 RepID=M6FBG8_9LEPT|nr:hypothetical protein LEP1GSC008_4619 [Leptospira kirschneri serovar Bulgarica str. Nikolaevo]
MKFAPRDCLVFRISHLICWGNSPGLFITPQIVVRNQASSILRFNVGGLFKTSA